MSGTAMFFTVNTRRPSERSMSRPMLGGLLLAVACLLLHGCGTLGASRSDAANAARRAGPASDDPVQAFEQNQRALAQSLENQGRLPEASVSWEALALLSPERYGDRLQDIRRRIAERAQATLASARQAWKEGRLFEAEQWYLETLALQPDQREASDALRMLERTRTRRELGKPPRFARSVAEANAPKNASANPLELEHAVELAGQGDLDEAIGIVEQRYRKNPRDEPARVLLADMLCRKANVQRQIDKNASLATLRRCLQLDPNSPGGLTLRNQLISSPGGRP